MKAIIIASKKVQDMLASRYGILDKDELLPIGYTLVTDFGNDETFDVITQEKFDANFVKVADLENGFFSIVNVT